MLNLRKEFLNRLCFLFFSAILFYQSGSAQASLGTYYMADENIKARPLSFEAQLGVRGSFHYDKNNLLATPPDLVLGELQATLWYQSSFGIYGFIDSSFASGTTSGPLFGGGIKYSFLNWKPRTAGNFIAWGSFQAAVDLANFNFAPAVAPQDYPTSAVVFRGGLNMTWGIRLTGLFLNTSLMVTYYSANLLLQPYLGIGYFFN